MIIVDFSIIIDISNYIPILTDFIVFDILKYNKSHNLPINLIIYVKIVLPDRPSFLSACISQLFHAL